MNAIERRFCLPFPYTFHGLFNRWILESNLKELGSAPPGVPGLKVDKLNSELQVQQLKQEPSPCPSSSSSCRSLFASPPCVSSLSISSSHLLSPSWPSPAWALAVGASPPPPPPAWRGPALNGLGAVSPCIFNGHARRAGVWV